MVITKDYALDLGARYSQYAMSVDAIKIVTFFVLFWVAIYVTIRLFKRCRHKDRSKKPNEYNDSDGVRWLFFALSLIAPIGFLVGTIQNSFDLVKRKFVPEVQMYQVIMDIKNGNTSSNDW